MKAVILAAGMGTRLRPLTDDKPKCLVPVHGTPVLGYALDTLQRANIDECVIVVGYRADQIESLVGNRYGRMKITYVENPIFDQTNNIYSFWLALPHLDDDMLLIEGDLLFDDSVIYDLLESPSPNVAVVDRYQEHMDGTVIMADGDIARAMILKSEQSDDFDYGPALKTVNIYKFSREMLQDIFSPRLNTFISNGDTEQYYEAVLAELIGTQALEMAVQITGPETWAEIDNVQDLRVAEQVFAKPVFPGRLAQAPTGVVGQYGLRI